MQYASLPAGGYVFKVIAVNPHGEWSRQPATYTFFIAAPFWERWWFILLSALIIAAIIYWLYLYRLYQALKVERLRSQISTDLHDDIGSTLSSISILSQMSLEEVHKPQSDEMLREIKTNSLTLMERMDDIVWSINPKNDSLENMMLRIQQFAGKLFESKGIEYEIVLDKEVKNLKLEMETRQHIYLILKEAINNLIKYSRCKKARIEAEMLGHALHILVWDDGVGFREHATNGNGLVNIRSRAKKIKGDLQIDSVEGKGTRIMLHLKIR